MSTTNILDLNNRIDKLEKTGIGSAAETSYSNTTSGLTATNVQSAIDELDGVTDNLSSAITDIEGDIVAIEGNIDDIEGDIDDLEGDVGSLDTRLDTLETDTGWVQIGTGDTYYRKVGKIVYVRTNAPTTSVSEWTTIDTLPEGYRPISGINLCLYTNGTKALNVNINYTGVISYINIGSASGMPIYVSFVAN